MKVGTYGVAGGLLAIAVGMLASVSTAWLAQLAPVENGILASWAQAVFTAAAIAGAYLIALWQSRNAETERVSLSLLGLQGMASEIAQICLLAGYQKEYPDERIIYSDIAREFADMAERLDRFSVDRVVECGEMEAMLHLRRICLEMESMHARDAGISGADFNSNNRTKVTELHTQARRHGIRLHGRIAGIGIKRHVNAVRTHL